MCHTTHLSKTMLFPIFSNVSLPTKNLAASAISPSCIPTKKAGWISDACSAHWCITVWNKPVYAAYALAVYDPLQHHLFPDCNFDFVLPSSRTLKMPRNKRLSLPMRGTSSKPRWPSFQPTPNWKKWYREKRNGPSPLKSRRNGWWNLSTGW